MGPQVTVAAQQASKPPPPAVTRPGFLRESGAKLGSEEEPTLNIHPHLYLLLFVLGRKHFFHTTQDIF